MTTDGLLRSADFRRLWLSSMLTQFGSQITPLALPICAVLLMHATPSQMGTLAALESLPFLLFGLPSDVVGFVLGTGFVGGGSAKQVLLFVIGRAQLADAAAKLAGTESAAPDGSRHGGRHGPAAWRAGRHPLMWPASPSRWRSCAGFAHANRNRRHRRRIH